jgi:hypothetical protein
MQMFTYVSEDVLPPFSEGGNNLLFSLLLLVSFGPLFWPILDISRTWHSILAGYLRLFFDPKN